MMCDPRLTRCIRSYSVQPSRGPVNVVKRIWSSMYGAAEEYRPQRREGTEDAAMAARQVEGAARMARKVAREKALKAEAAHAAAGAHAARAARARGRCTVDAFRFDYAFASYVHHGKRHTPTITSLTDMTEFEFTPRPKAPRVRVVETEVCAPAASGHGETVSVLSGDDALIASPYLLGIADGVSSWGPHSSAGTWSRLLLENMSRNVMIYKDQLTQANAPHQETEIVKCFDKSFHQTLAAMDLEAIEGSSTALVALILGTKLETLSIGDSKLYVIRNGALIETNEEQMRSSLCPQQLGTNHSDVLPSLVSWVHSIELQAGDIVITCSDGLSDNLWEDELVESVNRQMAKMERDGEVDMQKLANRLLYLAKDVAFDNYAVCPYTEKVNCLSAKQRCSDGLALGGKTDDISICVARVVGN